VRNENNHPRKTVLVFVHLGKNPSPTLNAFAQVASESLQDVTTYLLTDQADYHPAFPGIVLEIDRSKLPPGFKAHSHRRNELNRIAGGYWRYTLERLFALLQLPDDISPDLPILHMESDVYSSINRNTIQKMLEKVTKTSVVRYSNQSGIASILFSPNRKALEVTLTELDDLLASNRKITNDMELLGLGLNSGILAELPSMPDINWKIENKDEFGHDSYLIFDGAAIGQFLLGRDAIHTENKIVSGYQNPEFKLKLEKFEWSINASESALSKHVMAKTSDQEILHVANLHVHSKIILGQHNEELWHKMVNEANGVVQRSSTPVDHKHIHTIPVTVRDRIRLIRHRKASLNLQRAKVRIQEIFQGLKK